MNEEDLQAARLIIASLAMHALISINGDALGEPRATEQIADSPFGFADALIEKSGIKHYKVESPS